MRKLSGAPPMGLLLQAMAVDSLRWLQWARTKDGAKNRNRPESVAGKLFSDRAGTGEKTSGYNNGADFDKAWKEMTGNV